MFKIDLRMETGNVWKRHTDQRADAAQGNNGSATQGETPASEVG